MREGVGEISDALRVAVPPPPVKHLEGDLDPEKEKLLRMASLVGYSSVPQVSAALPY